VATGVCFHCEKNHKFQDLWSFAFSNFGVEDVWEIGQEDDMRVYQNPIPVRSAADLPDDRPLVVLSPRDAECIKGEVSLRQYDHEDDNTIFLFGRSHGVITEETLGGRKPDAVVYIPTVAHEMYAFCAAYIVLYDRFVKRGVRG